MKFDFPFKFGDTIYIVNGKQILEYPVNRIIILDEETYRVETCGTLPEYSEEFNKKWFLTREEAERALTDNTQ